MLIKTGRWRETFSDASGMTPELLTVIKIFMPHDRYATFPEVTTIGVGWVGACDGLEPDVQELILEAHNTVRRAVTPTASNMQLMSWDESIANLAQRWAENCVWGHDTNDTDIGRFSFGQNIAQSSGNLDWNKAISNWANEKNVYTYNGDNGGKVVGHYTQIVWAESSKVGCGYARCNGRNYYVCNYGPG
ncbi:cysteine-rich venom protein latisemin-like [Dreissena polymorpha]|uniref:cysteine-rich venom protein latisemin-like n=1 Tax=Dreissena polymorpha TaxID=45954 RepID=UPI0022653B45|nr:cysteine-rich venom protein latisemin-like [Dreissena polymorpha]